MKNSHGNESFHGCFKVQRVQRVQRVDGASPRRFLRFSSLTALWAEGCGIALRAMRIKSALRDFLLDYQC